MLIILTVFNFLCPFAKADTTDQMEETSKEGVSVRSAVDGILGILLLGQRAHISMIGKAMDLIMMAFNDFEAMDISTILFNHVELTDINFFNIDGASNDTIKTLRTAVAGWYTGIRNVAAALLVIICIYVGIRLALALTAEEKAKYKEMLRDWITSVALLFILHYVMLFVIAANNSIVKGIEDGIVAAMGKDSINDLSEQFFVNTWVNPDGGFQWSFMAGTVNAILYVTLKIMTLVFLILYIKRMVTIGFLIVIAPLVTITYSADKISDGKAQGMNTWFREFSFNVLIQPFQCIIFAALVSIASTLANTATVTSGFMALFLLIFIFEAEKLVKHIFNIQSSSLGDAIASAALAASVAQKGMAFADQVKGKAQSRIAANSKVRPELKKKQQAQKYDKLMSKNPRKANAYKKKIQAKENKMQKKLDKAKNPKHPKIASFAKGAFRGSYRVIAGANNIVFKAGMGFAIAGAMGEDEIAVGSAIYQGGKAAKENVAKEKAYYAGAQKHKIARAYNDYKDEEMQHIAEDYLSSGKNIGKTPIQQAEEMDKIFNDKVMALFSGESPAVTDKENKLLSGMKDYGVFLAAQGKNRDEQFDELEKIIDGIDSGSIGELWSGDDAGGLGGIPTYHLGESNKGAGRSQKTIIKDTIVSVKNAQKAKGKKATKDDIVKAFERDDKTGGVIEKDKNKKALKADFDSIDEKYKNKK
jgi:hypothetical protein